MNPAKFVQGAMILALGAFVIYTMTTDFCEKIAGFCDYGWYIFGAYIIGAGFWLRNALK